MPEHWGLRTGDWGLGQRSFELHHFADSSFSSTCPDSGYFPCVCGMHFVGLINLALQVAAGAINLQRSPSLPDPAEHLGNCQSICIQSIIATSIRQNKNSDSRSSRQTIANYPSSGGKPWGPGGLGIDQWKNINWQKSNEYLTSSPSTMFELQL